MKTIDVLYKSPFMYIGTSYLEQARFTGKWRLRKQDGDELEMLVEYTGADGKNFWHSEHFLSFVEIFEFSSMEAA